MHDYDTFTKEYLADGSELHTRRTELNKQHLGQAIRQAVSAEYLTSDEHWDEFLTHIEGTLQLLTEDREQWLNNCTLIGQAPEAKEFAIMNYHKLDAKIEVLAWIKELPKAIIDNGKKAKELQAS